MMTKDFTVSVSEDGKTYETVQTVAGNTAVQTEFVFETAKNARYVKVEITNPGTRGDGARIFEMCFFSDSTVTKEPTCTEVGEMTYTCMHGGAHTYIEEIAAKGHTEETVAGKDATCSETGLTEGKKCTVCGTVTVEQEAIDALGHDMVTDAAKAPTCTETGLTEGSHCSRCNDATTAQEVVPSNGHSPAEAVQENVVNATCGADGSYDSVVKCSSCGTELSRNTVTVEATGEHVYVTETEKVEATCTVDGYVIKACGCGAIEKAILTAPGHDYVATITDPTCITAGYTTNVCSVCGATYTSDEKVALGHTNSAAVKENEVAPNCDTEGSYDSVIYCSVCNAEVSREKITVDSLGHTEVVDAAIAATCTEAGKTEGKHCSVCNDTLVAQEVVPANGHTEVVDAAVAPTCIKLGKTEGKHCSVCNEVLVAQTTVAANGHTEVVDEAVAPTCTEAGKTAGKHCSACDEVLVAQNNVEALGHDFADATTEAPKTCKTCGATEGDKLPTPEEPVIPGADEEPKDEQPEEELNFFQRIWLAIVNFFKKLFGIK